MDPNNQTKIYSTKMTTSQDYSYQTRPLGSQVYINATKQITIPCFIANSLDVEKRMNMLLPGSHGIKRII